MKNETQEIQISVTDLALVKSLIDVACSRGAFKADEMKTVGELYEKISAFLENVLEQAKEAQSKESDND